MVAISCCSLVLFSASRNVTFGLLNFAVLSFSLCIFSTVLSIFGVDLVDLKSWLLITSLLALFLSNCTGGLSGDVIIKSFGSLDANIDWGDSFSTN